MVALVSESLARPERFRSPRPTSLECLIAAPFGVGYRSGTVARNGRVSGPSSASSKTLLWLT